MFAPLKSNLTRAVAKSLRQRQTHDEYERLSWLGEDSVPGIIKRDRNVSTGVAQRVAGWHVLLTDPCNRTCHLYPRERRQTTRLPVNT
jgi:hypothetical protein